MSKGSNRTRVVFATALCALGAAFPGLALADKDGKDPDCGLSTLHGQYLFAATGYTMPTGVAQPKAIVEVIDFNGNGTLSVPAATRSINGVVARSPAGGTGTYVLNADCIGTLSFTNGPNFDIFVSHKGGHDLWMIQTDANNVLQGKVTKIQ